MICWKNRYICLLALLVSLLSCQQESEVLDMGQSGFLLKLTDEVNVETRDTPAELGKPIASQFNVCITKQTGVTAGGTIYDGQYTEEMIPASINSYLIEATCGTNPVLGLDAPYYYGSATADITEEQLVASVTLNCKVANALATLKPVLVEGETDKENRFTKLFSDFGIVAILGNSSCYASNNFSESVYFRAGTVPTFIFKGTLRDTGREVTQAIIIPTETGFTAAAAEHLILKVSLKTTDTSSVIVTLEKAEVETVTISETIPVNWLPRPTVEAVGFDSNVMTHYETERVPDTQINFTTAIGLDDVSFTLDFNDEVYKSLNGDYVLSEMTDLQKQAFSDAGITLPEIGNVNKTNFDFTELIYKLSGNPDTNVSTVDNVIKITSVTANGKLAADESLQNYTIAVKAKPVFTVSVQDYNVWSKEFTADEASITEGYAAEVKAGLTFQYSQDGGKTWYDCNDNSNRRHAFSSHPADADRDMLVRAKFRNFISKNEAAIELEKPTQVPNSDMESWHITQETASSKTYYNFHPYAANASDNWWSTNNQIGQNGTIVFGIWWQGCFASSTSYTTDAHQGNKAASIFTNGHGHHYANTGQILYEEGSYAGSLFIGTFNYDSSNYDGEPIHGHSFPVRPTALQFYYKYAAYNTDQFKVWIALKNGDETIAEGTFIPASYSGSTSDSSYKLGTVNLSYNNLHKKATSICIQFLSTTKTSFSGSDIKKNQTVNYPEVGDWKVHIGSKLYIDDLSLIFNK
ncbi:MAG: DUF4493 domain-containing protein [Bacteroides sp.]|nr:DUF4493 domain-containing protein [Bacteroides sp.]MBO5016336.1 DUF4493 domain-containing protein [Bacteroidaceae bacterium]